jgi:hypothetical protein
MALQLTAREIASFDGPHRIVVVRGPLTLMRLCGRTAAGEANNPYGRFWFNDRFFWRVLDQISDDPRNVPLLNHHLKYVLREFTAVCREWNSFAAIYRLQVPAGTSVEVAVGRIAPQPLDSTRSGPGAAPANLLMGGDFQYILDLGSNPDLRRRVAGPIPLPARAGSA